MPFNVFTEERGAPDFINKIGTSFWMEIGLSKYAALKLGDRVRVFYAAPKNNPHNYSIIDYREGDAGELVKESQSYEGVCYYIDSMAPIIHQTI
jgi:hypothetical protein